MSRECPNKSGGGGGFGGGGGGRSYGGDRGGYDRDDDRRGGGGTCYQCGQSGHFVGIYARLLFKIMIIFCFFKGSRLSGCRR